MGHQSCVKENSNLRQFQDCHYQPTLHVHETDKHVLKTPSRSPDRIEYQLNVGCQTFNLKKKIIHMKNKPKPQNIYKNLSLI